MQRLESLLGALSIAGDLAAGLPLETSLRTCVLATRLARALGWPALDEVRHLTLLRHLGCTAFSHEASRLGGDDHDLLATYSGVDTAKRSAVIGRTVGRLARDAPFGKRVAAIARVVTHPRAGERLIAAQCEQAMALAGDLGMRDAVVASLGQMYERYDGGGGPRRLSGDAIAPAARLLHLVELVEIHHRSRGRDATVAEVKRRRGTHLDPVLVDAFVSERERLWGVLEAASVWDEFLEGDAADGSVFDVERIAQAFGRFADLKSPHTHGHSTAVATLAVAANDELASASRIRVAAVLHDLGVVSVPNAIWDKPKPLNASEWERVRLHAYHTHRILAQTPELAEVALIAGAHHERLDGGGYPRGANGPMLEREARLVAAADAYQSMREPRAFRAARSPEQAAEALAVDARDGKLCARAVDAVLAAAGQPRPERVLPAGLTPREVEVLVQLARGSTNKQIATSLGITVRTANHHVENIYGKLGVTTRTAAALFAVRHDLVSIDGQSCP